MDLREIEQIKGERLLEVLRRVIADPNCAEPVARVLAQDWNPMMKVDEKGTVSFAIDGSWDL